MDNGRIEQERQIDKIMGFVIHAFMAPFVDITEAGREWADAQLTFEATKDDTSLKEVTVKTLGEVYAGGSEDTKIEAWEIIRNRMKSGSAYVMKEVPDGVDFLTAFVDIQKRGFEVRVIGWSAHGKESWLIDAYLISQHLEPDRRMEPVNPFNSLADWSVLEDGVFNQTYPLKRNPNLHMPIAKIGIDTGGDDDTTANARQWASNVIHRAEDPIAEWRILLLKGNAHKKGELYGKPRQVLVDDRGKPLAGPVWERTTLVYALKKIVRRRQNITVPEPGFMHAPQNIPDKIIREVVAEQYVGGEWVKSGPNETWDAYIGCEVVRESLKPDRAGIDWVNRPPMWARPFRPGHDAGIDSKPRKLVSPYARMLRVNQGDEGDDEHVG